MAGLMITVGGAKKGGLAEEMLSKMRKKPAEKESEPESEGYGAAEEEAMQEFMDAVESGDAGEALGTFKALLKACGS